MHKTRFPTQSLILTVLLASMLSAFAYLALHAPQALAAPAIQTLPTAEPCQPAVLEPTSSVINARTGPGSDYPIMTELREGEVYPVAGRHHGFRWWAVTFSDGNTGWVWDNVVSVSGNITAVPLLEAPPLNGVVPDTVEDWTPTSVSPPCEATPEAVAETSSLPTPISVLATQDGINQTEEWSTPANLSQSGGASNPSMVIDNGDQFHIFWDDEFSGNYLVNGDDTAWSQPISVTAPFSGTAPLLIDDNNQNMFAIWRDDEEETLLFSNASTPQLAEDNAWSEPQNVDEAVLAYDALVDGSGVIHVAYVRIIQAASGGAGIYYRSSQDQGVTWTEPLALFESPYFRSLRLQDANVIIESTADGGNTHLYVGWDVRPRKRLYFTHSPDAGQTWEAPTTVAEPESTSNIILPFNLRIGADGNNVLLVWQVGQPEGACRLFYQASTDNGTSWSQRRQIDDLIPGTASCASKSAIFRGSEFFYLLATFPQQAFLLAWNGERWSDPQAQRVLTQFNNPETLNTVNLGCLQADVTAQDQLFVAGCDTSALTESQGDIWFLSRSLGPAESWFPSPGTWSRPTPIAESAVVMRDPQLISDNTSLTHAIWFQAEDPESAPRNIYHSQWDASGWSQPAQILTSPAPVTDLLATARRASDRIYILWTTASGETYLSQAQAGQLQVSTNWSPPEMLPLDADTHAIGTPTLFVGDTGALYVAYARPINEQRGIYVIQSVDNGVTWSAPTLLFDGEDAGWQIVGAPSLAVGPEGTLHLLFEERQWTDEAETTSVGLYYLRCTDLNTDCTTPRLSFDGAVLWKNILTDQSTVHQLWQGQGENGIIVQHDLSTDGGASWNRVDIVTTVDEAGTSGEKSAFLDNEGRLFLFMTTGGTLQSWIWENDTWRLDETLNRELSLAYEQHELAGSYAQNGNLVVAYADLAPLPLISTEEEPDNEPDYALLVSNRLLDEGSALPSATQTADAAVTSTAEPGITETETPLPSPTPSPPVELPPDVPDDNGLTLPFLDSSNPVSFLLISLVPVLLLVVVAVVIGLRRSRSRR